MYQKSAHSALQAASVSLFQPRPDQSDIASLSPWYLFRRACVLLYPSQLHFWTGTEESSQLCTLKQRFSALTTVQILGDLFFAGFICVKSMRMQHKGKCREMRNRLMDTAALLTLLSAAESWALFPVLSQDSQESSHFQSKD